MAATLQFLGRLEDIAGAPELHMALGGPQALEVLAHRLDPDLANAVMAPDVRVAINGALVAHPWETLVGPGDEVAFLPPVSGG
ncbi:MAG: MoaD/ThiS family protein [Sphingomonadales bacterium]|nr:MoaD/ThiS family protein [Sphingomonadales bacterium]MDE2568540.1 MoaD/ThiS family protein [Sphingomonadales bacterium]